MIMMGMVMARYLKDILKVPHIILLVYLSRVKGGKFGLRQFWTEVGQFWTFGYNLKNIFKSAIKSNLIQLCILGVYIDPIFYYKIPNFSS